jgi:hypothetical protein
MVEAAVHSSRTGTPIQIADILTTAHTDAITTTPPGPLQDVLRSWPSVQKVVGL